MKKDKTLLTSGVYIDAWGYIHISFLFFLPSFLTQPKMTNRTRICRHVKVPRAAKQRRLSETSQLSTVLAGLRKGNVWQMALYLFLKRNLPTFPSSHTLQNVQRIRAQHPYRLKYTHAPMHAQPKQSSWCILLSPFFRNNIFLQPQTITNIIQCRHDNVTQIVLSYTYVHWINARPHLHKLILVAIGLGCIYFFNAIRLKRKIVCENVCVW